MAIMRNRTQQGYTNVSNVIFRDERLSLKARGLLCTMLSLPDCWEFSEKGLQAIIPADGQTSIRTALKTLEECGYLVRRQVRENGLILGYEWEIYGTPQDAESPHLENHNMEIPNLEKQHQYITKESNTKESTTKDKKVSKKHSFDAIINAYTESPSTKELLGEWLQNRKAKRAAMTDNAIKRNIDKLDECARQSGMTVDAYLDEVIRRGWSAFFPIAIYNGKAFRAPQQQKPMTGENRETIAALEEFTF